jgi:hypothetical protein
VRQPAEDRALYYRQLRRTIATVFAPELTSATAKDAAGLVDRILAEFVVEEEWAPALSQEYGAEFETILGESGGAVVTPERFVELRRQAADGAGAKPCGPRRRAALPRAGRGVATVGPDGAVRA